MDNDVDAIWQLGRASVNRRFGIRRRHVLLRRISCRIADGITWLHRSPENDVDMTGSGDSDRLGSRSDLPPPSRATTEPGNFSPQGPFSQSQAEQQSSITGTSKPNIDTASRPQDLTVCSPEPAKGDTPHPPPHSAKERDHTRLHHPRSARIDRKGDPDYAQRKARGSAWLRKRLETRRSGGFGTVCKRTAAASSRESRRRPQRTGGALSANPTLMQCLLQGHRPKQATNADTDEPMDEGSVPANLAGFANLSI